MAVGWFVNPGFMPHIHCYLGQPSLVWSMVVTDTLIGLAYLAISITLWGIVRRLRLKFSPVIFSFGVFIGACGLTHFMEVWTLWFPDYWAAAGVKAITAFASVGTGAYLISLRHPIDAGVTAMRVSEQRRVELEQLSRELEVRVEKRTSEVAQAHRHLQSVVDAIPALIAHLSPDRRYQLINAAYEEWFGLPRAEIIGHTMEEVLGREAAALLEEPFDRALAGEQVQLERLVPYRLGGSRYVRVVYAPDRTPDGSLVGVTVLVTDMTELRQREEEVRRGNAQLAAAFEAISDGVMVFGMDGFPVQINEAQAHTIGYGSTEELRIHLADFQQVFELRTKDGALVLPGNWPIARVLRGESLPPTELRTSRRDTGQEWVFQFTGEPVRDSDGRQLLGVVITRDVTELKRTEQALRESEVQFRTMANSMPQLAWMADAEGSLFWYNQRWYEYTGTRLEQMQGWGWQAVHHPDHLERVTGKFRHHVEIGEPWEDTFPLRSKTGEWRWFLSRAEPIRDEEGRVSRWFGSNTDITEQLTKQRELEESLRNRDEFLSVASHELKTPLTSLVLQTQRLARVLDRNDAPPPVARLREYLQAVDRQTRRFTRLVDDMLDLTRIRTGQLGLKATRQSLEVVVRDVLERTRPVLAAARLQVHVEVLDAVEGVWDRFRLEQVLSNLLTNAARYSEGTPLEIRIERRDGRARVSVRDQGRGLRPEDRERIFGRFERAVSRDEVSGLGLGLYISRFIVEAHGGRLWAESPGLGLGTTFILELPIETAAEAASAAPN